MAKKTMTNQEFIERCKQLVADYTYKHLDPTDRAVSDIDPYVVWMCKTLQNCKALLSTPVSNGMYYEFTWNGDNGELYMDCYKKWENRSITFREVSL